MVCFGNSLDSVEVSGIFGATDSSKIGFSPCVVMGFHH